MTNFESLYLRNFNKELKLKIQHLALDEGVTMGDIIQRACKIYIKSMEEEVNK